MALVLMKHGPQVTTGTWVSLGVARLRGPCVLRTSCCYGDLFCLLCSRPSQPKSYMKTLSGLPAPHWTASLALTMIVLDLFQASLPDQTNDSVTWERT